MLYPWIGLNRGGRAFLWTERGIRHLYNSRIAVDMNLANWGGSTTHEAEEDTDEGCADPQPGQWASISFRRTWDLLYVGIYSLTVSGSSASSSITKAKDTSEPSQA